MTSVANVPVYMLPGAPVVQQPRAGVDAGDPSLATEILPGPPSMASVIQAATKRDPRKPGPTISYLPQHDPGTTYTGMLMGPAVGSLEGVPDVEGPRRKRARVDKGLASHRSQRASARGLNTAAPADDIEMGDPIASTALDNLDSYAATAEHDVNGPLLSRSNSVSIFDDAANGARDHASQRRDKGKGKAKEREARPARVKEEPLAVTLQMSDPISAVRNEDHCSACRSLGSLVYCDGCTRAYHLWCIDPPMEATDVPEGDSRWYCPSCVLRQHPPAKPPPSLLAPLIQHMQSHPPTEFQLPEDIRTFFKHVGTNARGAYVDTSLVKPPRLNRHGQLEDRDPFRTKDRSGQPVLCFHCGTSAIPEGMSVTAPPAKRSRRTSAQPTGTEQWRSIVSCDYCPLHWHLDCIEPPLLAMPPFDKKWMCPNHVENTLRIKRRTPRHNPTIVEISRSGQSNNGNIEIIEPEATATHDKVIVEEVFINGRRYRVPERVIKLDFWNKINVDRHPVEHTSGATASGMSSPLTSLSALDEDEQRLAFHPESIPPVKLEVEDLRLALCLLDFSSNAGSSSSAPAERPSQTSRRALVNDAAQTELSGNPAQLRLPVTENGVDKPVEKIKAKGKAREKSKENGRPVPALKLVDSDGKTLESGENAAESLASTAATGERKQPARASKRDVKYVMPMPDALDSADEGYGRHFAMDVDVSPTHAKAKRASKPRASGTRRRQSASSPKTSRSSALQPGPVPTLTPAAESLATPPAVAPQPSPGNANTSAAPASSTSLKIRLPRFGVAPTASKTTPASPPAIILKPPASRPRRSLRRATSAAGSSSTSVSKFEMKVESPAP